MRVIAKLWKVWIALILVGVAVFLYFTNYRTEKLAYEMATTQMQTMISALRAKLNEDMAYADVQDDLETQKVEIAASRLELYKHFPKEMKEEDQIMYAVYLETVFGTEIIVPVENPQLGFPINPEWGFNFGSVQVLNILSDGSTLMGLELQINYKTTYDGFKEMIDYLATDSRITSVKSASISYDAENDVAAGYLTLVLYLLDSPSTQYMPPDVAVPETGKDNVYLTPTTKK